MLKHGDFVHHKAKSFFFRIAWHLRTNVKCSGEVSMTIFFWIYPGIYPLITAWLSASRRWSIENIEISPYAQGRRLSLLQTQDDVWNRSRFLKKHFMFLEELNRSIRKKGLISYRLPGCLVTPYHTAYFGFFPDFSHLFSDSDHFFRDPWVPLTFSHSCLLFTISR